MLLSIGQALKEVAEKKDNKMNYFFVSVIFVLIRTEIYQYDCTLLQLNQERIL